MRVSAVVPAYNYRHTIGRALESILQQTSPVEEILVIDDGSTDGTGDAVAAVQRRHAEAKITYVRQQNAGPSAARNHGARLAAGDWVAFLDADDYWYPAKIALQAGLAARFPQAGLVFSGVDVETGDGIRKPKPLPKTGIYRWAELLRENWVLSPTPVVRKDLIVRHPFDESMRHAEDWDCWLRVAACAPAAGQRDIVACYLDHGTGLHASAAMAEGTRKTLGTALARGARFLGRGEADRALGSLVAAEAVAAAAKGEREAFLQAARQAVRLDYRQAPRMGWASLFSMVRGRLYA